MLDNLWRVDHELAVAALSSISVPRRVGLLRLPSMTPLDEG
jgi:hypothetical protein